MQREMTLDNLKHLDLGVTQASLEHCIRLAAADCFDRPTNESARKVTLTFSLKPQMDEKGNCEHVFLQCHVASKIPPRNSYVFQCRSTKNGQLLFNDETPENVDQMSFGDLKDEPSDKETS